jgi:2,5-furandicarboxylate decarboxylase 1
MVASIRKSPGEGKNALLALLSQGILKMAIVTDADVDIFNQEELEWALAYRVQADRDVIIVQDTRGKHLDPSTRSWELPPGQLPTSARIGIDATIPDRVPMGKYEHQQYPFLEKVRAGVLPKQSGNVTRSAIVGKIQERLRQEPAFFSDIVDMFEGAPYPEILRAWGALRLTTKLERDEEGRYRCAT